MVFVTSDLHGRADCLKKLLDHVGFGEDEENWLYIIGDVIDRNDKGGVDILKWLLYQPNVQLILGNHEQMMLANRWVFEEIREDNVDSINSEKISLLSNWQYNGGECTIKALQRETPETRQDILDYLDDCPMIEGVSINERNYLLVHSGLGNFAPEKRLRDYTPEELLWTRPDLETKYAPEKFTVILGHTPTGYYSPKYRNRMIKTESWWDIDTGAASENGRPMLLCLDTCKAYYIEDDGSVVEE